MIVNVYVEGKRIGKAKLFSAQQVKAVWEKLKAFVLEIIERVKKRFNTILSFFYQKEQERLENLLKITKKTTARRKLIKRQKYIQDKIKTLPP